MYKKLEYRDAEPFDNNIDLYDDISENELIEEKIWAIKYEMKCLKKKSYANNVIDLDAYDNESFEAILNHEIEETRKLSNEIRQLNSRLFEIYPTHNSLNT